MAFSTLYAHFFPSSFLNISTSFGEWRWIVRANILFIQPKSKCSVDYIFSDLVAVKEVD